MREDPPPDFKCKDKFLVQSIQLSEELEVLPLPDLWAHVEKNLKGQVSERRLRAVYLMPTEESLRRRDESLNLPNAGGASINSSLTPALENASILSDTEGKFPGRGQTECRIRRRRCCKAGFSQTGAGKGQ